MKLLLTFLAILLLSSPLLAQTPTTQPTTQPLAIQPALAELPLWPIGIRLADDLAGERVAKNKNRKADILVWIPPESKKIRAIFLLPENTDSKAFHEYTPLRKVAAKHDAAIVYLRGFFTGIEYHHAKPTETPPAAPTNILKLLDLLATETKMPEFKHAPFVTFGKSSRGEFPFRMAWLYPDRVIAGITYHGESPTWPIPAYAAKQNSTILYCAANGQEEWDGTWYRAVRPYLLNYRANTPWLPHQIVAFNVGHGNYTDAAGSKGWNKPVPDTTTSVLKIWDYLTLFADTALTLRLPPEKDKSFPTDAPTKLTNLDPSTGYLIHPRAIETLLDSKWMALRNKEGVYQDIPWPAEKHPVLDDKEQGPLDLKLLIQKAQDVPEAERKNYMYIPTKDLATAWLKVMNIKNKDVPIP